MKKKGVEFNDDCWIYEVCNPVQAKEVLAANGAVSTALPCRISVYGSECDYTRLHPRDGSSYRPHDDVCIS
jgi:uncharacterized protein (DUF302 family)